jgi:hypothetical protein
VPGSHGRTNPKRSFNPPLDLNSKVRTILFESGITEKEVYMPFLDDIRKDLTEKTASEKIVEIKSLAEKGENREALRKIAGLSEDNYIEIPDEDLRYVIKLAGDAGKITDDEKEVDTSETQFGDIPEGAGDNDLDGTVKGQEKPKEDDLTIGGDEESGKDKDLRKDPKNPKGKKDTDSIALSPDEKVAKLLEAHGQGVTNFYAKVAESLRKRSAEKLAMLKEHKRVAGVLNKLAEEHGEEVITALASAAFMKGARSETKRNGG